MPNALSRILSPASLVLFIASLLPLSVLGQDNTTGIQHPVEFSAKDSLVISLKQSGKIGRLIGDSKVTFNDASLGAYRIDLLFKLSELRAYRAVGDTALARFTQSSDTFTGDQFAYNLKTERGRILGARSSFQDGFIRAQAAKIKEDSTLYVYNGVYSTCNCIEDPSYSLRAKRMKIVDQKWVYTGPIRLFIFNIPTPLWLPFGFLPAQEGRRSGPLAPVYGEDEFGFYLRDFGWYFALNDYTDYQMQFGLWSKGSWQTKHQFRYNRRYNYNGAVAVDYARLRNGERGDPDFGVNQTVSIRWNHNQTISPYSSFDASVDLSTSGYLQAVSEAYDDRVRQTVGSTVGFRKRWKGVGRSLTTKLSQQQQLASGTADLTLPNLSFSQSARKPFSRSSRGPGSREQWFEKLTYNYNFNLTNSFRFSPLSDSQLISSGDSSATSIDWYEALFDPAKYRRATGDGTPFNFKASHSIPISASFTLNRLPPFGNVPINMSPSFRYTEDWYLRTEDRSLTDTDSLIIKDETEFLALRQFNAGLSANTTFYGLFPVKIGRYSGIRHTVRPTLGFTYQPDFSASGWGYTGSYTDSTGQTTSYSRVPGVRSGLQQSLSFSVANIFETKRLPPDSLDQQQAKTLKLLNLDLSSRYNFAADSLKLSDISLNLRTKVAGKVDVTVRGNFSPYKLNESGRVINDYVWKPSGLKFARMTSLRATARTSIRSANSSTGRPVENRSAANRTAPLPSGSNPFVGDVDRFDDALAYADFAIPWSLSFDFTFSVTKPGLQLSRQAIVNTTVDFNLTPNWKVAARTGYDIERGDIVSTSLNLHRDFECWQMSVNWVPFGSYQSWGFDLHVKSGHLMDILRIRQPRNDVGGRFGRISGQ
ncbi:MAG: LPS-assembly protein LptD [Rhodothermales bacterium]|nr:LPS-assembly protein LptD [Rhodothermales bacterium]